MLGGGFFIASAFPAACASDGPCTSHGNAVTYGAGLLAVGTVAGILLLATGGDSATVTQN